MKYLMIGYDDYSEPHILLLDSLDEVKEMVLFWKDELGIEDPSIFHIANQIDVNGFPIKSN